MNKGEISNFPDLDTAIAAHRALVAAFASPVRMGRFYLKVLEQNLCPTQAALARTLNVSPSRVSRSIAAALLPMRVLRSFSDEDHITFEIAGAISKLIRQHGKQLVTSRALSVPGGSSPDVVKSILLTGKIQAECLRSEEAVSFSLSVCRGHGRRYVRLDSPNIDRIVPVLARLEDLVKAFLPTLIR